MAIALRWRPLSRVTTSLAPAAADLPGAATQAASVTRAWYGAALHGDHFGRPIASRPVGHGFVFFDHGFPYYHDCYAPVRTRRMARRRYVCDE
jgi:hypothetical protein